MARKHSTAAIVLLTLLAFSGCDAPTAPDSRTGEMALRLVCDPSGASPLICVAQSYCSGLYRCPDPAGDNADVTARSTWTVDDPGVVRQVASNMFVSAGTGNTVIKARDPQIQREATARVSVFAGTAPLLTAEVWGRVTEAGTRREISGAAIELTGGVVAKRSAISGTPAPLIPGYFFLLGGTNGFQFFGIPRGTYQLTIRAAGYASQSRTISVEPPGGPSVSFELVPE